jgi:hypothetical protein
MKTFSNSSYWEINPINKMYKNKVSGGVDRQFPNGFASKFQISIVW